MHRAILDIVDFVMGAIIALASPSVIVLRCGKHTSLSYPLGCGGAHLLQHCSRCNWMTSILVQRRIQLSFSTAFQCVKIKKNASMCIEC